MDNKIKSERFRALSIAALVIGILAFSPTIISPLLELQIVSYGRFGLSIAALVCGSIDLIRIEEGRSNKGRGFDIAGMVLGGIPLLAILFRLVPSLLLF